MNEGMFNEIKRRLDTLINLHERLIDLIEAQMTQPLANEPVTPKTMPREEPVQSWQNYDKMTARDEMEKEVQERAAEVAQLNTTKRKK